METGRTLELGEKLKIMRDTKGSYVSGARKQACSLQIPTFHLWPYRANRIDSLV